MKPYYDHAGIQIFHGDCREILPSISGVDLVLADPPYGIDAAVDNARFSGGNQTGPRSAVNARKKVAGDTKEFDPSHLLRFKRLILWGANNYAKLLPQSNGWIIWDKRKGLEDMENWPLGEGEMAWTNVTGAVRFFRNRWMGLVRDSEQGEFYHPTQKPVALMQWCIQRFGRKIGAIVDPYAGSGPTLVAAKNLGREAVGIEIEEEYCEIAARRLEQEVFAL